MKPSNSLRERFAKEFELAGILSDEADTGHGVDNNRVCVARQQCLNSHAEVFVAIDSLGPDEIDGSQFVCCALLNSSAKILKGGETGGIHIAIFVGASQQSLSIFHIWLREGHNLSPLGSDGNAVRCHVELTRGRSFEDAIPGPLFHERHAVQANTYFLPDVIVPPCRLAVTTPIKLKGGYAFSTATRTSRPPRSGSCVSPP
jgi:hypothetical protein